MTLIDVDNIQHHKNTIVIHLTRAQAIEFTAAIDENVKNLKDDIMGLMLMTIRFGPAIIVGLWSKEVYYFPDPEASDNEWSSHNDSDNDSAVGLCDFCTVRVLETRDQGDKSGDWR